MCVISNTTICLLVSKMGRTDTQKRSWESRLRCCCTAGKVIRSVSNFLSLKTDLWLNLVTFKDPGLQTPPKINADSAILYKRNYTWCTWIQRDNKLKIHRAIAFFGHASTVFWYCLGKFLLHCIVQAVLAELPSFWMHAFEIIIMIMWIPSNLTVI